MSYIFQNFNKMLLLQCDLKWEKILPSVAHNYKSNPQIEYCYFNVSRKILLYCSITENILLKNTLVFLLVFSNIQTNIND